MSCLSFFGQCRRRQATTTTVDAFVVGQRAADQHGAVQFVSGLGVDAHDHATIVEQQLVAYAAILDQIRVVDTHDLLVATGQRMSGREGELVTDLQLYSLVGELCDTDLRTLQVAQQSDEAPVSGGDFADQPGASLVLVGSTVGEVQTSNVQTRKDQLFDDFRRIACRAKCGDDFGAANGHAQTP